MCDRCVNGICTENGCECFLSFTGSSCNYNQSFASIGIFVALLLLLAPLFHIVSKRSIRFVVYHPTRFNDFDFPRRYPKQTKPLARLYTRMLGPKNLRPVLPPQGKSNVILGLVVLGFMLEWLTILMAVGLPIYSWSDSAVHHVAVGLIYFGSEEIHFARVPPGTFTTILMSVILVPLLIILSGLRRCALIKPQPAATPYEDSNSLLCRFYFEYWSIPILTYLLLPLRCLAAIETSIQVENECFTQSHFVYLLLGMIGALLYGTMSKIVTLQLNSEATHPQSIFYSDFRYMQIHHTLKAIISLAIICFGRTHPYMHVVTMVFVSGFYSYVNILMLPSRFHAINCIRIAQYGTCFIVSMVAFIGTVSESTLPSMSILLVIIVNTLCAKASYILIRKYLPVFGVNPKILYESSEPAISMKESKEDTKALSPTNEQITFDVQ